MYIQINNMKNYLSYLKGKVFLKNPFPHGIYQYYTVDRNQYLNNFNLKIYNYIPKISI